MSFWMAGRKSRRRVPLGQLVDLEFREGLPGIKSEKAQPNA